MIDDAQPRPLSMRASVEEVGTEAVATAGAVDAAPAAAAAAAAAPSASDARQLRFTLDGQSFAGRLHQAASGDAAVLWVFGSGGGLGGPSGGIYARLAASLVSRGVTSLELDYRRLRDLDSCVEDVLTGIDYLVGLGQRRIVLVGHSFGGRVVITAATRAPSVVAVAAMSSVDAPVETLGDTPLLLVHGERDEVVPHTVSLDLFKRAGAGKELLLYPDCAHGLDQCGTALDRDLAAWIGTELDLSV